MRYEWKPSVLNVGNNVISPRARSGLPNREEAASKKIDDEEGALNARRRLCSRINHLCMNGDRDSLDARTINDAN